MPEIQGERLVEKKKKKWREYRKKFTP